MTSAEAIIKVRELIGDQRVVMLSSIAPSGRLQRLTTLALGKLSSERPDLGDSGSIAMGQEGRLLPALALQALSAA